MRHMPAIMPAGIGERRLEQLAGSQTRERADDVRLALLLTYLTLGWMTIEGAASLLLGWASKSLLLEAFGIDSVIELFSAGVLLWRLRIEASGFADEARVEALALIPFLIKEARAAIEGEDTCCKGM